MKSWIAKLKQNFDSRVNLKRASINSSWLLIEQVIRIVIGFIVSVAVTRYLGPKGLGVLSYASSWVSMFSAISILGVDSIVIKKLIEDKEKDGVIIGSSLVLKMFGGFVATLLSVLTIMLFGNHDLNIIILVIILSLSYLLQSCGVVDLYYQSKLKVLYPTTVRIISYVVVILLKILCILFSLNIYIFASIIVLEALFILVGYLYIFFKNEKIRLGFNLAESKKILISALPVFLSIFIVGIYSKVDLILLGRISGNETLGYYSLAVNLIQMFSFIPVIVISSVFPILIQEKTNLNLLSYRKKVIITVKYLAIVALLLVICANLLSNYLVRLLYGVQFIPTVRLVNLYSINMIFVFSSSIFSFWMIIENKQKLNLIFQFCGLIVAVILNLILIPLYGAIGACYSSLLINLFFCIFYLVLFYKMHNDTFLV